MTPVTFYGQAPFPVADYASGIPKELHLPLVNHTTPPEA